MRETREYYIAKALVFLTVAAVCAAVGHNYVASFLKFIGGSINVTF